MGKLRRLPGEYYGHHRYQISGSLDAVVPGRRTVGRLIVGRLGPQASEGLAPLGAFSDLRELELEWPVNVNLEPLAAIALEQLRIDNARSVDLEPIARIETLERLSIIAPDDCAVPSYWPLSPTLREIMLMARDGDGRLLSDAVSAIPWPQLRSPLTTTDASHAAHPTATHITPLPARSGLRMWDAPRDAQHGRALDAGVRDVGLALDREARGAERHALSDAGRGHDDQSIARCDVHVAHLPDHAGVEGGRSPAVGPRERDRAVAHPDRDGLSIVADRRGLAIPRRRADQVKRGEPPRPGPRRIAARAPAGPSAADPAGACTDRHKAAARGVGRDAVDGSATGGGEQRLDPIAVTRPEPTERIGDRERPVA